MQFCFYLDDIIGAGAFGEVYVAEAIGIAGFDPRLKISMKHKPLLSRRRFSSRYTRTESLHGPKTKDKVASSKVAVKKLKGNFYSVINILCTSRI